MMDWMKENPKMAFLAMVFVVGTIGSIAMTAITGSKSPVVLETPEIPAEPTVVGEDK